MATNTLGSGVTRFITDRDRQFAAVIFQADKPPLDSEVNLISMIDLESRAEEVRSRVASGWLMNEFNPKSDFVTDVAYSNQFYFGQLTQTTGTRDIKWAIVNGWPIPVCGTATGTPPLSPNDSEFSNRVALPAVSSATGGNRQDFVFLEVWLQRLDVDPPGSSAVAPGKPVRGYVYRFGNVNSGFSYLPDELVDPDINYETTKRVQIQYKIRTVSGVSLSTNPEGFDPNTVFAQGPLTSATTIPFTNMGQELGDPGLWRAGTGDPNEFGTVDTYVYAIPLCTVFRRNSFGFSDSNLAGSWSRNGGTAAASYTATAALPSGGVTATIGSFVLSSAAFANTVLSTITDFSAAYFKLDDEMVRITGISESGGNYTVSMLRSRLNTVAAAHAAGTTLEPYSIRPDGLFADQVADTDILDLRHSIADKFDYAAILQTNLNALLKGELRSTWKRFGASNVQGPVVTYGDYLTGSTTAVNGLTKLDGPDGNRRTWSDAAVMQRFVVPVTVPDTTTALSTNLATVVAPYAINVQWSAAAPGHNAATSNRLSGSTPYWWNGDTIKVLKSSFTGSSPTAVFVDPADIVNAVVVRFDGTTSDPAGGQPGSTSPSATILDLPTPGSSPFILTNGNGINVTFDGNGDLEIELANGTSGNAVALWATALQALTGVTNAQKLKMYVEFTVLYGAGRGLSHRPRYVNTPYLVDSNTSQLQRPGGVTDYPMVPTYLSDSPYVQTGINRTFARTSDAMIDPGSKTAYIAPYTYQAVPPLMVRGGDKNNWYGSGPTYSGQGLMPTKDVDNSDTVNVVDGLGLFDKGNSSSKFIEVPFEYLPRPGLHHVPILPQSVTEGMFSGINFLLRSDGETVANSNKFNPSVVAYPNPAAPGFYIVSTTNTSNYGTVAAAGSAVYGLRTAISGLTNSDGTPFRGIRFPAFYGPARITGVYQQISGGLTPSGGSPFTNDRVLGGSGTATNLLKTNFDGPTFLLDVDNQGDLTFVLNAEAINVDLISAGADFDDYDYLVECTLFGFDRGFCQTNGRLVTVASPAAGATNTVNTFITSSDGLGVITPAPVPAGNSVKVFYNASPYQGDVFGTQTSYSDSAYSQGIESQSEVSSLASNTLGAPSTLTLPNKNGFEILASLSFETSLGTGRLSGSNPIPLLTAAQAPNNPTDYANTLVDVSRETSLNRVGFEDWAETIYPVVVPANTNDMPVLKPGALSEQFDYDIHPELAGCTTTLPLGAYFRDKDFAGKMLYQQRSFSGVAAVPIGVYQTVPYEAAQTSPTPGQSTFQGREFVCGSASNAMGGGQEALIRVDGTSSTTSTTIFKTTRGGAAYMASGPWPGGPLSARLPKARPNTEVGSVLLGTAYLVRSGSEYIGSTLVHPGNELQMVVVTQATPAYFRDTEIQHSAAGTGEGYTAVDRYRLLGKPLEKRRGKVNTSILPSARPLFVNKIYDDPLYWGSSDPTLITEKQETVAVTSAGQTSFSITERPAAANSVQMFINGVKQQYGVDYTVTGTTMQTVTYVPGPTLVTTDIVEFFYTLA